MNITDAAVEAASVALHLDACTDDEHDACDRSDWAREAKVALEAALPHLQPTIPASDRYAANENRRKRAQREGASEPDPLDELLCPKCGHGIDSHGWDGDYAITCCLTCDDPDDCRQAPSDIARHLIAHGYTASPDREEDQ